MKRIGVSVGIITALAVLHGAAWAETTPAPATPQVGTTAPGGADAGMPGSPRGAGRRRAPRQSACAADIAKFCASVERGQGRYRECLTQHLEELSPACKEHVQGRAGAGGRGAARSRWQASCGTEIDKFCKDVQSGQGRVRQCLLEHESELGESCKAAVQAPRGGGR